MAKIIKALPSNEDRAQIILIVKRAQTSLGYDKRITSAGGITPLGHTHWVLIASPAVFGQR